MDKDHTFTEPEVKPSQDVMTVRMYLARIPLLKALYQRLQPILHRQTPFLSTSYWEERYRTGGNSGFGSYGQFAEFKAEILNDFVVVNEIQSLIEFGCGDGNQLRLARYPLYLGYDVSDMAVTICQSTFADDATKSFKLISQYDNETAELALSLDVIYHLVEDEIFDLYMRRLFSAAERFVIIYSSNFEDRPRQVTLHVRHRKFTQWVDENIRGWSLVRHIPNRYSPNQDGTQGSSADFYLYAPSN